MQVVYYSAFVFATVALSRVIHFGRQLEKQVQGAIFWGGLWLLLLFGAIVVLGLFIYEGERAKGTLQRRSRFYEGILARWRQDSS